MRPRDKTGRRKLDRLSKALSLPACMTPVRFILNERMHPNHSVRSAGACFAPANRNLKFISSPGSSAIAV